MSYKFINVYDEVTGKITAQIKLPASRVQDYLDNRLQPGKRGLDMGTETIRISEGIEFSDKDNPRADNVRKRENK